jgi:hypothetical protein
LSRLDFEKQSSSFTEKLNGEKPLHNPHTPQQTRRVLLGSSVLPSPANRCNCGASIVAFSQAHGFCAADTSCSSARDLAPDNSFVLHRHVLGSSGFLSFSSFCRWLSSLSRHKVGFWHNPFFWQCCLCFESLLVIVEPVET